MPATIGSFALGPGDAMLVALRTGIYRFDRRTASLELFAPPPFDPHRFAWNDGKADPLGRFWAGPMYAPLDRRGEGPKAAPLHLILPSGEQIAKTAPVRISNALAWSAGARTLYHADTTAQEIAAYDVVDLERGMLGERRSFARVAVPNGGPDGGATDTEGCYWSAVYNGSKVVRFTPDGRVEREVAIPVPTVTMIAFGGDDLRTAYVTTAARPFDAANRVDDPQWGAIFAFGAPAPGVPVPPLVSGYFA
jgi:sugar lactone lactonase YvrE